MSGDKRRFGFWNPAPARHSPLEDAQGIFTGSMIAALGNAALVVGTAAFAAYPLARMEFRGKRIVFAMIVATLFIPPVILTIPNYLIVGELKWLDSLVAVIVPTAASAFGVFFLRQFFMTLPRELEEAALIDGANRFQTFWRVVLPLSRPALVSLRPVSGSVSFSASQWDSVEIPWFSAAAMV